LLKPVDGLADQGAITIGRHEGEDYEVRKEEVPVALELPVAKFRVSELGDLALAYVTLSPKERTEKGVQSH